MKTKIILHGKLAKLFGREFEFFNIKKPIDAISAINSRNKNFSQTIKDYQKLGQFYELILDDEPVEAFSLENKNKESIKVIEIVPAIVGCDDVGAFFAIAIGVFLTAVSFGAFGPVAFGFTMTAAGGGLTAVGAFTMALGLGLVMAGITFLLTPMPEPDNREIESSIKSDSFLFQGANNIASQGQPVPLAYGRMRVGSQVISSTIRNSDIESQENPYLQGEGGKGSSSEEFRLLGRLSLSLESATLAK
jgi:predicted phage tail protein